MKYDNESDSLIKGKSKKALTRVVSIQLPVDILEKINVICKSTKQSRSAVLTNLINIAFSNMDKS